MCNSVHMESTRLLRTYKLQVRINPADHDRLQKVADALGTDRSDTIRYLIRKEHDARFGK